MTAPGTKRRPKPGQAFGQTGLTEVYLAGSGVCSVGIQQHPAVQALAGKHQLLKKTDGFF